VVDAAGATTAAEGCSDRNIAVRTANGSGAGSDIQLFWKLEMPDPQTAGEYSGTNTLVAAASNQCASGSGLLPFSIATDFNSSEDTAENVALQSDGKMVVVGATNVNGNTDFAVFRYKTDGTLDTDFGCGTPGTCTGKVATAFSSNMDVTRDVAIDGNGKIVVVGSAYTGSVFQIAVARYNTNGTLDDTFDGNSGTGNGKVTTTLAGGNSQGSAVAIDSNNKIIVAGSDVNAGTSTFAMVRLNTDGTLDTDFGCASLGTCSGKVSTAIGSNHSSAGAVLIQPSGKILVGGSIYGGAVGAFAMARYNTNGTLDDTFDGESGMPTTYPGNGIVTTEFYGGGTQIYSLLQQGTKIIAYGSGRLPDGAWGSESAYVMSRYDSDGLLDSSFGTSGKSQVDIGHYYNTAQSAALDSSNRIVGTGYAQDVDGNTYFFRTVRFTADGALDNTFGTSGITDTVIDYDDEAMDVAIQSDGMIVVVGYSGDSSYENYDAVLVRYNADGTL